jgi:hypothetical protein
MLINGNSCVQLHNPFPCFSEVLMEHCCSCQSNPFRVNRSVDGIAFIHFDYLSFIELSNLFVVKEVLMYCYAHTF